MRKQPKKREVATISSLEDLIPDSQNANAGTQRGLGMIEDSLSEYGAGRSVIADRAGRLIAGNKTVEAAMNRGMTEVIVVRSSGDAIIVHQREDLDLEEDTEAVELGIADNRASEVSLSWSPDVVQNLISTNKIRPDKFWQKTELDEMFGKPKEKSERNLDPTQKPVPEQYLVIVECLNEVEQTDLLTNLLEQGLNVRALTS